LKTGKKANFVVPSGNAGNITAAFWAKKLGFPIDEISMSLNSNDTINEYIKTSQFTPKSSVETLANAMDVGHPSNFERLVNLLDGHDNFVKNVKAVCADDTQITDQIRNVYKEYGYTMCPHTATGFYARSKFDENKDYIIVSTAHPSKFESVIEPILGIEVPPTKELQELLDKKQHKVFINNSMQELCDVYSNSI
jgi:threonine synthase